MQGRHLFALFQLEILEVEPGSFSFPFHDFPNESFPRVSGLNPNGYKIFKYIIEAALDEASLNIKSIQIVLFVRQEPYGGFNEM